MEQFWAELSTDLKEKIKKKKEEIAENVAKNDALRARLITHMKRHSQRVPDTRFAKTIGRRTTIIKRTMRRKTLMGIEKRRKFHDAFDTWQMTIEQQFYDSLHGDAFTLKPFHEVEREIERVKQKTKEVINGAEQVMRTGKAECEELEKKCLAVGAFLKFIKPFLDEMSFAEAKMIQRVLQLQRQSRLDCCVGGSYLNPEVEMQREIAKLRARIKHLEKTAQ